jgi:phospholipid/cholesterol/gamma-HCH transport system substrate-binding protein
MRFKIRFADQIVGIFVIVSLVSLLLVIVLLGYNQRWFARDVTYYTVLPSAGGLSKNMAVHFKGFTIGSVSSFHLTDKDHVEVIFVIHENYADRVRYGSMVEVMVSPIGLGSQFLFHSGNGELLPEDSFIPAVGTAHARELIRQGLAAETHHDDSISLILSRVNSILDEANRLIVEVNEAFVTGTDATEIGRIAGSLQRTMTGVEAIPEMLEQMLEEILANFTPLLASVLENFNDILAQINNPDSLLYMVMDTEQDVYVNLVNSLASVSSILDNLDKTVARELPQLSVLMTELREAISTAEDVLTSLTNNPLLRRGIPQRVESQSGAASPRGIRF